MRDPKNNIDLRLDYPATTRNRKAILNVLKETLPSTGTILELASGSGQHITYFARAFTGLRWQPSDADETVFPSIVAWTNFYKVDDIVHIPVRIDTRMKSWPVQHIENLGALLAINLIHISPWESTISLFLNAKRYLAPNAKVFLYGPFKLGNGLDAPSNLAFDDLLKAQNKEWGVRTLKEVEALALQYGFVISKIVTMPANNLSLILERIC